MIWARSTGFATGNRGCSVIFLRFWLMLALVPVLAEPDCGEKAALVPYVESPSGRQKFKKTSLECLALVDNCFS